MVSFSLYYSMSCLLNQGSYQRAFKENFPYLYLQFCLIYDCQCWHHMPFLFHITQVCQHKRLHYFAVPVYLDSDWEYRVIAKFKTCNNISSWWDTTENEQQRIYIYIFFFFFFFRPLLAVAFLKMTQSEPRL